LAALLAKFVIGEVVNPVFEITRRRIGRVAFATPLLSGESLQDLAVGMAKDAIRFRADTRKHGYARSVVPLLAESDYKKNMN
jgi:hypothetical protein